MLQIGVFPHKNSRSGYFIKEYPSSHAKDLFQFDLLQDEPTNSNDKCPRIDVITLQRIMDEARNQWEIDS